MIIVLVEIGIEPSALDTARDAIRKMEHETRKESGCVGYAFSVDVCDPSKVRVTERWQSMDALKSHMVSPHMAEFQTSVATLQPSSLDIKAYEVAREVQLPR